MKRKSPQSKLNVIIAQAAAIKKWKLIAGNSKLTLGQALKIRKLKNIEGLSQYAVARQFNVTQATVSAIWLNKIWVSPRHSL